MGRIIIGFAIGYAAASPGHAILGIFIALIALAILIYNDPGLGLG